MKNFGAGLVEAAEQAKAIARGEASPESYEVYVPSDLDVKGIRKALGLTQAVFARAFGFPIGTLRDIEQGRVTPDSATRAYLKVIQHEPQAVRRALEAA